MKNKDKQKKAEGLKVNEVSIVTEDKVREMMWLVDDEFDELRVKGDMKSYSEKVILPD